MDAALTLSKLRAAMVVGDFDFTNNGAPLTALPAILTALNATYTRNSVKNVVQNGALVSLSDNQFGTSYDPVAATYGYVPEPAATNLATNSDGNASTYTVSNVSDGTAVPGFTNGIAFGNNSLTRYAYKPIALADNTAHSISVFVIMDDGGAPVVGTSNITGDMGLVVDGFLVTATALVRLIGYNVYRISASITTGSVVGSANCGVVKYTGQSARTFRITGIQVETGNRATSYIATTGSTASRSADVLTVPLWINNVKDSQDGSTASWVKGNGVVTTDGTLTPSGSPAQLFTVTASATTTTLYNGSCLAPSSSVVYSIKVKKGNLNTCTLVLRNNTTGVNFNSGVLTYATGAITGTGWTATSLSNGWFLCTYTSQPSDVITVGNSLRAFVHFLGSAPNPTAGDTAYFGDAQIEPGSVATAYRPTTATLESAANANITGFSSAGYTLAVDQRMDTTLSASTVAADLNDLTASNRAFIFALSGVTATVQNASGGSGDASISVGTLGLTRSKYAGSYQVNKILGAKGGVAGTEDTSAAMAAAPRVLSIGASYSTSIQYNGYLFRAQLIPQALTQAQLNGLTT